MANPVCSPYGTAEMTGPVLPDMGERAEFYNIPADRSESKDVAKEHPEVVARHTKLAHERLATLPLQPDPSCISTADRGKAEPPGKKRGGKYSHPASRFRNQPL